MVYLIRCSYYDYSTDTPINLLKIGFSEDDNSWKKRFEAYKNHNPLCELVMIILEGTRDHESRLHYKFHHLLHSGREWFKESNDLLDFFRTATLKDLEDLPSPASKERIRKYPIFEYSSLLSVDCPEEIKDFFKEYDKFKTFLEKIKFICEYLIQYPHHSEAIIGNLVDSDKIKQQLIVLGPARIRGLGYNITKISQVMGITIFDRSSLDQEVYRTFQVGQRYTKKFIKAELGGIYKAADFKGTPKANDIEHWFEVSRCRVSFDGKQQEAFEIVQKKL